MTIVVHLHSPEAGVASLHGRLVRIDRQSKWGNPFVVGRDGTRVACVQQYEAWIQTQPHLLAALPELRDKVLGCWCKRSGMEGLGSGRPNHLAERPCHGDVLARLVNTLFPGEPMPWEPQEKVCD